MSEPEVSPRAQQAANNLRHEVEGVSPPKYDAPSVTSIIVLFFIMSVIIVVISIIPIFEIIPLYSEIEKNQRIIVDLAKTNKVYQHEAKDELCKFYLTWRSSPQGSKSEGLDTYCK